MNSRWAIQISFLSEEFRLLAGHDYPVNLMIGSVLNLSVQIERKVL
mgnify:CR=1 FL=1